MIEESRLAPDSPDVESRIGGGATIDEI